MTRAQLLAAGVGPSTVRWYVRTRRLRRLYGGVYQVGPVPLPRARAMAAVLACGAGACISHASAAVLWRLRSRGRPDGRIDVTVVGADRGCRPGIRPHRVRVLRAGEATQLDGIPLTTVARTVLDIAAAVGSGDLRRIVALAVREHGVETAELVELMRSHPKRRGAPLLRALLAEAGPPAFVRSEAEDRLLGLITRAKLPQPDVNVRIRGLEVDFLWRRQRLVVEVDGFAYHSGRLPFENDRRRDADLAACGIRVMRVTWRQLETEPEAVLARIAQSLAVRSGA